MLQYGNDKLKLSTSGLFGGQNALIGETVAQYEHRVCGTMLSMHIRRTGVDEDLHGGTKTEGNNTP